MRSSFLILDLKKYAGKRQSRKEDIGKMFHRQREIGKRMMSYERWKGHEYVCGKKNV